jgi:membrane protease YdiL (CAAX protease family)
MVEGVSRRWPVLFAVFVLALSLPFWRFGAGSLVFVCPAAATLLLVGWADGRAGLRRLRRRLVDFSAPRPRWWLVPALGAAPLAVFVTCWLAHAFVRPLSAPTVPPASIPVLCCVFLLGAVGEEIGWSGYLTGPMVRRFGMLGGGVLIGLISAAWRLPVWSGDPLAWIAGQFLLTVAFRVIIVRLYDRTGKSLPVAILCRTTVNVAVFLLPSAGSHFDPLVAGLVATVIAAAVIGFDRTQGLTCANAAIDEAHVS